MNICLYVNEQKPRACAMREAVAAKAAESGIRVVEKPAADVVVVLGGDGTMLKAVHEFPGVPVLGLNLGGLGYLSSVGERDYERALALLAAGGYRVAERSMLQVNGHRALNDIVFSREMSGHACVLELSVDGKTPTKYLGDGLIVATPTGSTAYSLAAGGPVLMPDSPSFVVTPMCPHALGVRPMVIGDAATLKLTSRGRAGGAAERIGVYADGEFVMTLDPGEAVELSKSPHGAAMVELEGYDPYGVLARKLGWSGIAC